MRPAAPCIAAFAAVAVTGMNLGAVHSEVHPPVRPSNLDASDTHASVSLLGQFRTSVSSWLWVRTDLYLHNGVEMRPLSEAEVKAGVKGVGGSEKGEEQLHDDDNIVTVVPTAERDFRGIFGDVERATRAYKDMRNHGHNDPKDALPLFRLMTWLDPQFVPGWTTGAIVKARDRSNKGTTEALAFLDEGYRANPWSVDISTQIGFLLITRRGDLKNAIPRLQEARKNGVANWKTLGEDEREALLTCFRWLGLAQRNSGQYAELAATMQEARRFFPEDAVLIRLSNPPPLVLTPRGEAAWNAKTTEEEAKRVEEASEFGHDDHDHDHHHH